MGETVSIAARVISLTTPKQNDGGRDTRHQPALKSHFVQGTETDRPTAQEREEEYPEFLFGNELAHFDPHVFKKKFL